MNFENPPKHINPRLIKRLWERKGKPGTLLHRIEGVEIKVQNIPFVGEFWFKEHPIFGNLK